MLGGTVWTYSREQKKKLSQSRSGIHFFALFCIEGITFNCAIGACARAKRPGIFREGGGLLRLIRNHSKVSFENLGTVFFCPGKNDQLFTHWFCQYDQCSIVELPQVRQVGRNIGAPVLRSAHRLIFPSELHQMS